MTTSQPVVPSVITLTSTGVDILSPPPAATDIIDAGQPVQLRLNLAINGMNSIVSMYANEPVQVKHHIQQVETNTTSTLGPFNFTTPATVAALNAGFTFITGPFTTGLSSSGATFRTAPGDDDGLYRVITEFHFTTGKLNSVFDDRVLVVTA
jgi:hypothetical protein